MAAAARVLEAGHVPQRRKLMLKEVNDLPRITQSEIMNCIPDLACKTQEPTLPTLVRSQQPCGRHQNQKLALSIMGCVTHPFASQCLLCHLRAELGCRPETVQGLCQFEPSVILTHLPKLGILCPTHNIMTCLCRPRGKPWS